MQKITCPKKEEYITLKRNSEGLAKHALYCLTVPTAYIWGGIGERITLPYLLDKRKTYPEKFPISELPKKLLFSDGKTRGFDCSGLINNFYMGGLYGYRYEPSLDRSSSVLIQGSKKIGDITSLPDLPGICLYMPGHVGIYVGGYGNVVECTSNPKFGNGVVKTKLCDRAWEKWFVL